MADKTLTFTTRQCGGNLFIHVDNDVIKTKKNKKILFKNELNKASDEEDPPVIEITFFEAGTAKAQPISGVCDGISGDKLVISDGELECKLEKGAVFSTESLAYMVVTPSGSTNPHEPLDPVIIIQPQFSALILSLGALFSGFVATVVGRLVLRAFSKDQSGGTQ